MPFTRPIGLALVAAVTLVVVGGGCNPPAGQRIDNAKASFQTADPPDPKYLPLVHFDDIPLPNNFILNRNVSFSYVHGTLRVLDLHLSGLTRAEDVAKFLLTQMQAHQWVLERATGEPYDRLLEFTKQEEKAKLRVSVAGKMTLLHIKVDRR